jgi:circadian clock protein KaiB
MDNKDRVLFYDSESKEPVYVLRLFVTGVSPASVRAINNIQTILDEYLKDRYELEIIDVHQQPELAQSEDIIAVPVLIKKFPGPRRCMVGDMSDTIRVLHGLDLV